MHPIADAAVKFSEHYRRQSSPFLELGCLEWNTRMQAFRVVRDARLQPAALIILDVPSGMGFNLEIERRS